MVTAENLPENPDLIFSVRSELFSQAVLAESVSDAASAPNAPGPWGHGGPGRLCISSSPRSHLIAPYFLPPSPSTAMFHTQPFLPATLLHLREARGRAGARSAWTQEGVQVEVGGLGPGRGSKARAGTASAASGTLSKASKMPPVPRVGAKDREGMRWCVAGSLYCSLGHRS